MFKHIPVLLKESIDGLNINKDGIYVDATLGGGGHSKEILKILDNGNGKLIGIDQDDDAIKSIEKKLNEYIKKNKLYIVKNNFENITNILTNLNIEKIDGIIFDLGVSSYQFDEKDRGFSYRYDARLDMRMDKSNSLDCYKLINEYEETKIYHIIKEYGEEKFAKNIAKHIVANRQIKKIETTFELAEIIKNAIPAKMRWGEKHEKNPAKRTFQALRIYINRELEVIENALNDIINKLSDGGRIVVITFNSLEDRLVKDIFYQFANPCTCPKNYPCICGKKSLGKIINKKIIVATNEELNSNKRAKPAKLRIFERRYYDK